MMLCFYNHTQKYSSISYFRNRDLINQILSLHLSKCVDKGGKGVSTPGTLKFPLQGTFCKSSTLK